MKHLFPVCHMIYVKHVMSTCSWDIVFKFMKCLMVTLSLVCVKWKENKIRNDLSKKIHNNCTVRGVLDQVVRVIDLESLAPHHYGFKSHSGTWILSCEEGIQLTECWWFYSGYQLMPEIMHREAHEVFLHQ